jgi:hypothetical protein
MPTSITVARALALALAAGSGSAWAGTLDYTLYAGIRHSDNITLSSENPVSQNELIPGLSFTYLQQGSTLQANITGALEYHNYPGNRFDSQTQTQLAGQANWTVLPQRLDFSVMDYAGIQPVDSLASNAPGNQQQTNVLSLGPILHLRFGDALRGQAELQYISSYASKVDDFNSSRGVAAFRLFRDISATDQFSINAETQHVRFDNSSNTNFDRDELYAHYTNKRARFDTNVMIGWSQLHFPNAPNASKPLARMTFEWRPTLRTTFTLAGVYQYSDAAQDMLQPLDKALGNSGGVISTGNATINPQVYQERRLEAIYAFHSERLTLSLTPIVGKLQYLNDPTFDQTSHGGVVSLAYRLRPTLTLTGFADGERLTYSDLGRRDSTVRLGLDLGQQWTSHWNWHASVIRQRRNSNAANQSYRETEIFFGVVYRR